MVVDLLTRQRAGTIVLSDSDRSLMAAMMHSSDDDAADALWARYGGSDHRAFNTDFPRYGMTDLAPQPGFSATFPYWGFQKSTANDLDRLINYTLTQIAPQTLPPSSTSCSTSRRISSRVCGGRVRRCCRAIRMAGRWNRAAGW